MTAWGRAYSFMPLPLVQRRKDFGTFEGDVDAFVDGFQRAIEKNGAGSLLTVCGTRTIEIRYRPLSEGGWVTTMEDITERTRYEQRIAHMAHYDSLTDLPNRALFRERLEQWLKLIRVMWPECPSRVCHDGRYLVVNRANAIWGGDVDVRA